MVQPHPQPHPMPLDLSFSTSISICLKLAVSATSRFSLRLSVWLTPWLLLVSMYSCKCKYMRVCGVCLREHGYAVYLPVCKRQMSVFPVFLCRLPP